MLYIYVCPLDYFAPPLRFLLKCYIYVYVRYLYPKIQSRCIFYVDSDSDLRLELGARLGLTFSRTRAFARFGCGLPVRCAKGYILGAP